MLAENIGGQPTDFDILLFESVPRTTNGRLNMAILKARTASLDSREKKSLKHNQKKRMSESQ